MFSITFPGMEVTQQPIGPLSILLALLEDGCDICLFPVIRDLLKSPGLFKETLDLCMPSWLECSLILAQKLFPGSWRQGSVYCSYISAESAAPPPHLGPEGPPSMAALQSLCTQLLLVSHQLHVLVCRHLRRAARYSVVRRAVQEPPPAYCTTGTSSPPPHAFSALQVVVILP